MKYTAEITENLISSYQSGTPVDDIATQLGVPARSVIAKLSSLGVYERKQYLNKQGKPPTSKAVWINRIADQLGVPAERLESLEKSNKNVLELLCDRLSRTP